MKKIYILLALVAMCTASFSQTNFDNFIGTWVYQNNDTIFKIKLQKGETKGIHYNHGVWGGYYLSVNGVVLADYIKPMPSVVANLSYYPDYNIYITAWSNDPNYLGFRFYDQKIKHIDGKGIGGGEMNLLSHNKLRWTLDEEFGLWHANEGEFIKESEDDIDTITYTAQGFSVPTNVIMTKEATNLGEIQKP